MMCEFVKLPNGIVKKDLILSVTKHEKEYRDGKTLYSVIVVTAGKQFEYNEAGKKLYYSDDSKNRAEQKIDKIYEDIVKQIKGE